MTDNTVIVSAELVKFAAALDEMWAKLCADPAYDEFFAQFGTATIELHTNRGPAISYHEDSIIFHPEGL